MPPVVGVVSAVAVVCLAAYVHRLYTSAAETVTLDRNKLGGTYVDVEGGTTHYSFREPKVTPQGLVLFVHGGTVPGFVFDLLVEKALGAGYATLTYDRFGLGRSDRPKFAKYDMRMYQRQVVGVVDIVRHEQGVANLPLHVVGLSFGGPIAASYAASYPVTSLTLLAPVVEYTANGALLSLASTPVVGRVALRLLMPLMSKRASAGLALLVDNPDSEVDAAMVRRYEELFREQVSIEGYQSAFLAMVKNSLRNDHRPIYDRLAGQGVPTCVVWGDQDAEIRRLEVDYVANTVPGAKLHVLPGATHELSFEAAPAVSKIMVDCMQSASYNSH